MATPPTPARADKPEASPADLVFSIARKFLEHLAMVTNRAREYRRSPDPSDAWKGVAFDFAEAFIGWYSLTHLVTPAVRTQARRVYPPGAPPVRLGAGTRTAHFAPTLPEEIASALTAFRVVKLDATPYPTVIEALVDGLGVYLRNAVYAERRHPLEPDRGETHAAALARLGIKTYRDAQKLLMREWTTQDRARGESALYMLRCEPVNFADLRMQLETISNRAE